MATTTTPPAPVGASSAPDARRLSRRATLSVILVSLAGTATETLGRRLRDIRSDESGNVITDNLGWIVFGVLAIVVIGALIKTLGSTVVNWVSSQLGV